MGVKGRNDLARWNSGAQQRTGAKRCGTGDFAQFAAGVDIAVANAGVQHPGHTRFHTVGVP
jgi:hypothetical protein